MNQDIEDNTVDFVTQSYHASKGRVISIIIALMVSIFVGWYYYEYYYLLSQEIPLLKAPVDPIRIKPEGYDGMLIPNTDKMVYDHLKSDKQYGKHDMQIMPEPEQPIDIPRSTTDSTTDPIEKIISNILSTENHILAENETKSAPRTLNIISTMDQKSYRHINTITKKKCYRIELASTRNLRSAEAEWKRMQRMYYKSLVNMPYIIKKVTVKNKGAFYSLLIGEFMDFSVAKSICKKLPPTQSCIIIKD